MIEYLLSLLFVIFLTNFFTFFLVKRLISGPSSSNQQPTSPASSIGTGQSNVAMLIDDDCDITVNKMKVSLRCPLSLLRISEPAKGQNCRHIGVSKKKHIN
jgi:hypothetical protein